MNDSDNWIREELLQAFYEVVNDFKTGLIDEIMFKERLARLAGRYERSFGKGQFSENQASLFHEE